jgi:hypothetical protein
MNPEKSNQSVPEFEPPATDNAELDINFSTSDMLDLGFAH